MDVNGLFVLFDVHGLCFFNLGQMDDGACSALDFGLIRRVDGIVCLFP